MKSKALFIVLFHICCFQLQAQHLDKKEYYYLLDSNGKKVMPDSIKAYDYIYHFKNNLIHSDYISISYNKKRAAADSLGNIVFPFLYDGIGFYSDTLLFPVYRNREDRYSDREYGFYDKQGNLVVPYQYDDYYYKTEYGNFCRVSKDGSWGAVDLKTGKETVPCIYAGMGPYTGCISARAKNGKRGILSKTGKVILPLEYKSIKHRGRALGHQIYIIDELYYLVDTENGKVLISGLDYICDRGPKEITHVRMGDKYAFINKRGEYVTDFIYDGGDTSLYGGGFGIKDGIYSYLDSLGNTIMSQPSKIHEQGDTLVVYADDFEEYYDRTGKMIKKEQVEPWIAPDALFISYRKLYSIGYENKEGKLVIPYEYVFGSDFDNGLAVVSKKSKKYRVDRGLRIPLNSTGVIDKNNNEVIPFVYDMIQFSGENSLILTKGDELVFSDRKGNKLSDHIYEKVEHLQKPYHKAFRNKKWVIVNYDGIEVSPCIYDKIDYFGNEYSSHTFFLVRKNGKSGIFSVNMKEEYLPCIYDEIKIRDNYIHVKYKGKWGLFTIEKQLLADPYYDLEVKLVGKDKSLVLAKKNGQWGIVDFAGKVRIPFNNLEIEPFYDLFIAKSHILY